MARAIAICEDGPLKGSVLSVELGGDGQPPNLDSRAPLVGVLYVPAGEIDLTPEQEDQFMFGDDERIQHLQAFKYKATEWTAPSEEVQNG